MKRESKKGGGRRESLEASTKTSHALPVDTEALPGSGVTCPFVFSAVGKYIIAGEDKYHDTYKLPRIHSIWK